MATANDVLMDTLTCPVCRSVLDKPRSLPCGHTFCLNCIQQLYEQKRNDDSDSDDHDYENVAAAVTVSFLSCCKLHLKSLFITNCRPIAAHVSFC